MFKYMIQSHFIISVISFISLFFFYGKDSLSNTTLIFCSIILLNAISASVHYAEVIAKRVGPALGTLILALSVTIIEVGLILSLMSIEKTNTGSTIARDTVFSAIMIVTNGVIGMCLFIGGLRHKELGFQSQGTSTLIGVLAVLSTLTLVLPNFTTSSVGPTFSAGQLIFASVASLVLYGALVWAQTISQKSYFEAITNEQFIKLEQENYVPSRNQSIVAFLGLILSLLVVIGMAKTLSPFIEKTLVDMGAPQATVGIIIALLVLAPETLASISAAKMNQLQTSLNLALGSAAASIALTIPIVSIYSIMNDKTITLGLDGKSLVLLILTFMSAGSTFGTGRTTTLQGIVHLVILASYVALSFMP